MPLPSALVRATARPLRPPGPLVAVCWPHAVICAARAPAATFQWPPVQPAVAHPIAQLFSLAHLAHTPPLHPPARHPLVDWTLDPPALGDGSAPEPELDLTDLCDLGFVVGDRPGNDLALAVAMAWAATRPGFLMFCSHTTQDVCLNSGVFAATEDVLEAAQLIGRGAFVCTPSCLHRVSGVPTATVYMRLCARLRLCACAHVCVTVYCLACISARISPGTPIFLYNFMERRLLGLFVALEPVFVVPGPAAALGPGSPALPVRCKVMSVVACPYLGPDDFMPFFVVRGSVAVEIPRADGRGGWSAGGRRGGGWRLLWVLPHNTCGSLMSLLPSCSVGLVGGAVL
jgi:hypothetical protein